MLIIMTKEKHKFNFSITIRIWDGVDKILNSALRILKVMRFMEMALFLGLHSPSMYCGMVPVCFPIIYGASASVSAFSFLS